MHSSRMRTVHCSGCRGVSAQGVSAWGMSAQGMSAGGCLPGGESARHPLPPVNRMIDRFLRKYYLAATSLWTVTNETNGQKLLQVL